MTLPLAEIFSDEDYRFHLTLRKSDLADFFSPRGPELLPARWRTLDESRSACVFGDEQADGLVAEFERLYRGKENAEAALSRSSSLEDRLEALARSLEPDFVLLSKDTTGTFRVKAGAVCFPTSWAPAEKLNETLEQVHGIVPGLNDSIGSPISLFLQRLRPGTAYERANWGLAATSQLNLHPAMSPSRLGSPLDPSKTWVRIEDQILGALPSGAGIVFGIRLRIFHLASILADAALRKGLRRALTTMPDALATYKGLDLVRGELRQILQ